MNYLEPARTMSDYGLGVAPDTIRECPICHKNNAQIMFNSHPMSRTNEVFPCSECKQKEDNSEINIIYDKKVTSIWKDKNGQDIAIDQRGKKTQNPYDYNNRGVDPHGWLKTHKKDYKKNLEKQGLV